MTYRTDGPRPDLFGVARRAPIRDLVFIRNGRSDKSERVRSHEHARNLRFNFWHVAGHAGAAVRSVAVKSMFRGRNSGSDAPCSGNSISNHLEKFSLPRLSILNGINSDLSV